jgi:hypothetical protein
MALGTVTMKVLPYSEIPAALKEHHWLDRIDDIKLQEVHIEGEEDERDDLSQWIIDNYPELQNEEAFFIDLKN